MKLFFQQLGVVGFMILALVFFVLQLVSRPFIGSGATFFGLLGGISGLIGIALAIHFKNKNKMKS